MSTSATHAPACRVCGSARPGGTDECPCCGASESECRRWRRRSDARWQRLREAMRVRVLLYFVVLPGQLIGVGVLAANVGATPPAERGAWLDAAVGFSFSWTVRLLMLGLAIASGIALDRAVRKLPTWNLVRWHWVKHVPVATVLIGSLAATGGRHNALAAAIAATGTLLALAGICRMTAVIAQMNRWVEADRRAASAVPHPGPVRIPWYRTPAASACLWTVLPLVLLALVVPRYFWIAAWVSWGVACISAERALGRWLRD